LQRRSGVGGDALFFFVSHFAQRSQRFFLM
jgi:hypothetical protein